MELLRHSKSWVKTKRKGPKGFFRNMLLFFAVLGPGIITSNVNNDAGGIATYSIAGADFGYTLLWTVVPVIFLLIIIQEMSARMGAITGKGLADLIRENFGVKATFYIMFALLIANLGNTMAEFAGVAASLEIFGVSKYITVPIAAVFVWFLVVKGSYKSVEKVFLIACLFYITYIISGFLSSPDWGEVGAESIKPSFDFSYAYVYMIVGIVGTTIAPWQQFYLQSSIVEKGVDAATYRQSRWDVIVGCIVAGVVVFFIMVACAATIHKSGVKITSAADAALALKPLAGEYCSILFAFGLFTASLFAASVLPLSTAYYVCEGMGWEAGVDKTFKEAKNFYILYTAIIALGAIIVLVPKFPLFFIMVFSQVINGVLLPFVLIFMLLLINKIELMGEFVNSKIINIISWITVITLIVLSLILIIMMIF